MLLTTRPLRIDMVDEDAQLASELSCGTSKKPSCRMHDRRPGLDKMSFDKHRDGFDLVHEAECFRQSVGRADLQRG